MKDYFEMVNGKVYIASYPINNVFLIIKGEKRTTAVKVLVRDGHRVYTMCLNWDPDLDGYYTQGQPHLWKTLLRLLSDCSLGQLLSYTNTGVCLFQDFTKAPSRKPDYYQDGFAVFAFNASRNQLDQALVSGPCKLMW